MPEDFGNIDSHFEGRWVDIQGKGETCSKCEDEVYTRLYIYVLSTETGGETYLNSLDAALCPACYEKTVYQEPAESKSLAELIEERIHKLGRPEPLTQDQINEMVAILFPRMRAQLSDHKISIDHFQKKIKEIEKKLKGLLPP